MLFSQLQTQLQPITGITTAPGTTNGSTVTPSVIQVQLLNQFNKCLAKVPQAQVEEMMAWIQNLTGQTNG